LTREDDGPLIPDFLLLDRQKLAGREPDVEIGTYDDIVASAQKRLMLIKSAER